jgi:ribosomal-protein-alanine N-acetyltransferase
MTSDFFESERLLLRPVAEQDIPFLEEALTNPAVLQFMSIRFSSDQPGQEQWAWYQSQLAAGTALFLAATRKSDGAWMGVSSVYYYDATNQHAELGYWLLPAYWGQGYAHEAALTTITAAQQTWPKLHRIEAIIESDHHSSRRLLQKCHFSHEGTLREVELKGEKWIDLEVWALLLGA